MGTWRLAWRNVRRNRRRTGVTVAATSLALTIMILYSGLVGGYLTDMEKNLLDLELGDLQLTYEDYRKKPSLYTRIPDPDGVVERLADAGSPAAPRLEASGLAAACDSSACAMLVGVDVARDRRVSRIHERVERGAWLDPAAPDGVVVGRVLARVLAVGPGDEILLLGQAADGSTANDLYEVRGVLGQVGDAADRSGLFLVEEAFRELMIVPDGAHRIVVRRSEDSEPLAIAKQNVSEIAGSLTVRTWRELVPTLASMLDSARGALYGMFLIVYVAIGILILNAMLMAVFERVHEFGVLKALGVGPGGVLRLILAETALQVALAILVGGALAVPGLWYLSSVGLELAGMDGLAVQGATFGPLMRAQVSPRVFVGPVAMLVAAVFVAVLYPALKAALIRPVRAIHHT